eukprot:scaffold13189_cov103-Isochrysis_galbana.AAC.4
MAQPRTLVTSWPRPVAHRTNARRLDSGSKSALLEYPEHFLGHLGEGVALVKDQVHRRQRAELVSPGCGGASKDDGDPNEAPVTELPRQLRAHDLRRQDVLIEQHDVGLPLLTEVGAEVRVEVAHGNVHKGVHLLLCGAERARLLQTGVQVVLHEQGLDHARYALIVERAHPQGARRALRGLRPCHRAALFSDTRARRLRLGLRCSRRTVGSHRGGWLHGRARRDAQRGHGVRPLHVCPAQVGHGRNGLDASNGNRRLLGIGGFTLGLDAAAIERVSRLVRLAAVGRVQIEQPIAYVLHQRVGLDHNVDCRVVARLVDFEAGLVACHDAD